MPAAAEKKPAPRTPRAAGTQPKPPAPAAPPPPPDYLTREQIDWLLKGIEPYRVAHKGGQSNMQAYDVRNHLNEVFGFANWSSDVTDMTLIFDTPVQLKNSKPGAYVCYRATLRLTIKALSGKELATYTEVAMGDAQMPAYMRAEAHDFALKTAESQALKRAAINLGNQFGLSLYAKGSTNSITRGTFAYPSQTTLAPLTEQITEETDPDASHEAATAFEAAEATQAPVTAQNPPAVPPPAPEPPAAQQPPPPVTQEQEKETRPTAILEDIADLQEALTFLSNEARAELMVRWKKTTLPPLARISSQEQLAAAWQLYDQVKPPAAVQPTAEEPPRNVHGDVAAAAGAGAARQEHVDASWGLTQQRQAQVDQARRHLGVTDDTPQPYSDDQSWQDNTEFYNE